MVKILSEISQLSQKDCFNIVERHKTSFTYPLHQHREYELNFVENAPGVRRIVGDSVEETGDYDLVLIGTGGLQHVWEQGRCTSQDIREITIQFEPELFPDEVLSKNQFASIGKMLQQSRLGLAFPLSAIMKVYSSLDTLANNPNSFSQFIQMLQILNDLSASDYRVLSTSSFANADKVMESRRVTKVKDYIAEHYTEDLKLEDLASLVGMSPSSFSRFFKLRTNKNLSTYIIDIRLGVAARALVDSSQNISEICYESGFNNISNFNRVFKARKGISPKEFRQLYKKKKIII